MNTRVLASSFTPIRKLSHISSLPDKIDDEEMLRNIVSSSPAEAAIIL